MTVTTGGLAIDHAKVQVLRRSLGAHLAMYRRAAGVAQPELGRALGRTRSTVSKIEHGTRTMPEALWKTADELCHAEGALVAEYQALAQVEQDYRAQCRAQRAQVRQSQAQTQLEALKASPASWLGEPSGGGVWPGMTDVDGQLAEELLQVVTQLIRSIGRRKAIALVGYVLAAVGLSSLDAEESTRLAHAVATPRRMDAKVVTNLAVSLVQSKRLEDTLGPCEVLDSVVAQHQIVRRLVTGGCPDTLVKPLTLVESDMASAIGGYLTDTGHPQQAMRYFAHARRAGHDASNPTYAAYAAANAALTAFLRGDTPTALDTAAAARSLAARTHDARLKALAEQMAAAAYALDGQYQPCMSACGRAHEFLANTTGPTPDSLAYWVHEGTLDSQRSLFLCLLGKPTQAVQAASTACTQFDRTFAGSWGRCQVRLGHALVLSHDITEASRILGQAASQAHLSPRLTTELHTARRLMQPWKKTHAVTTLDAQLEAYGLLPPHQTSSIQRA
jgi:transcriptional regulator with XRE-family HTH domain